MVGFESIIVVFLIFLFYFMFFCLFMLGFEMILFDIIRRIRASKGVEFRVRLITMS